MGSLFSRDAAADRRPAAKERHRAVAEGESPGRVTTRGIGASIFVYERKGSMFIDSDGDQAHEFYEERTDDSGRKTLDKVPTDQLRPQDKVPYEIPRLNRDLPFAMMDYE